MIIKRSPVAKDCVYHTKQHYDIIEQVWSAFKRLENFLKFRKFLLSLVMQHSEKKEPRLKSLKC